MTIQINYLENGIGIEIIASGIVTGDDIVVAHKEIYNEENLNKQKYQIVDRSKCKEYQVTSEDIKRIALIDLKASKMNPDIIIAIVASSDLQFGMSRVWQVYVGESLLKTEVFRDRKSANEWIWNQL